MMENCILIADSGSSKTDWVIWSSKHGISAYHTAGVNPVRDGKDAMLSVLEQELLPQLKQPLHSIGNIYFYGAGCVEPYSENVKQCLEQCFSQARIEVESDLLGAARALCGHSPGIACILGTGSNSCFYNGTDVVQNVSPLGFILGDEGSGAVLGKLLVGLVFKGKDSALKQLFLDECGLNIADVIARVYRQPQPNRFLASLVPFIHRHRKLESLHNLLVEQFRQFILRNVAHYGHPEIPINFVGSVAAVFEQELREALHIEGYKLGIILQKPIEALVKFHTK